MPVSIYDSIDENTEDYFKKMIDEGRHEGEAYIQNLLAFKHGFPHVHPIMYLSREPKDLFI